MAWLPLGGSVAALLALGAAAVAVPLLLTRESPPPEPPPFAPPAPGFRLTEVVAVGEGQPLLSDRTIQLEATTLVERLEPISPQEVERGNVVAVVGLPDEVRNYRIVLLVVLPSGGEEGQPRTPAGFAGHEPFGANATTVAWGTVAGIEGRTVRLERREFGMTLTLEDGAPLVRIARGDPSGLQPGDRLAVRLDPEGRPVAALAVPARYLPAAR